MEVEVFVFIPLGNIYLAGTALILHVVIYQVSILNWFGGSCFSGKWGVLPWNLGLQGGRGVRHRSLPSPGSLSSAPCKGAPVPCRQLPASGSPAVCPCTAPLHLPQPTLENPEGSPQALSSTCPGQCGWLTVCGGGGGEDPGRARRGGEVGAGWSQTQSEGPGKLPAEAAVLRKLRHQWGCFWPPPYISPRFG